MLGEGLSFSPSIAASPNSQEAFQARSFHNHSSHSPTILIRIPAPPLKKARMKFPPVGYGEDPALLMLSWKT